MNRESCAPRAKNRATLACPVPLAGPPSGGVAIGQPHTDVRVYVIGRKIPHFCFNRGVSLWRGRAETQRSPVSV